MKNNLNDLNNHLFDQLERLMDDEVCHDEQSTKLEILKANTVTSVAKQIIESGRTQLSALKVASEWNLKGKDLPPLLEQKDYGKQVP